MRALCSLASASSSDRTSGRVADRFCASHSKANRTDESARRRFVREARAAASVRHPNVASVFHLGKSENSYFYAMEFVDGEPLDELIRRFGRLETKLALEIATQVATGLAAIHERNLVHRDIKPSNVMVKLKGESSMAKIIDLGLAKGMAESQSETAVSIPGSFAGTPEFASPEQFAGVNVDIRSDLYSLGVALWKMLTGRTPFRGTPGEVMASAHSFANCPTQTCPTAGSRSVGGAAAERPGAAFFKTRARS
jgi:serine/threonine protein kinase